MGNMLYIGKTSVPLKDDTDDVSDGYHTFGELYQYRMLYHAAFVNALAQPGPIEVVKSWRHSDGKPCFEKENYFVIVAQLPTGQITNHYKGEHWDLFHVPEVDRAPEYDGHTPQEAAQRLQDFLLNPGVIPEKSEEEADEPG